jgi:hypothetical protein
LISAGRCRFKAESGRAEAPAASFLPTGNRADLTGMSRTTPSTGRRLAAALWLPAAFALLLLAPGVSQAGCGARHDRPVVGLADLGSPRPAHASSPAPADHPGPPRCPGGICSRGDLPAPVPPSTYEPRRIDAWPCPVGDDRPAVDGATDLIAVGRIPAYTLPVLGAPERPPRG